MKPAGIERDIEKKLDQLDDDDDIDISDSFVSDKEAKQRYEKILEMSKDHLEKQEERRKENEATKIRWLKDLWNFIDPPNNKIHGVHLQNTLAEIEKIFRQRDPQRAPDLKVFEIEGNQIYDQNKFTGIVDARWGSKEMSLWRRALKECKDTGKQLRPMNGMDAIQAKYVGRGKARVSSDEFGTLWTTGDNSETKNSPFLKKEKKLHGTSHYDGLMKKNSFSSTKEEEKNKNGKDNQKNSESWKKNSTSASISTEIENETMEAKGEEDTKKNEDEQNEEEEEENPYDDLENIPEEDSPSGEDDEEEESSSEEEEEEEESAAAAVQGNFNDFYDK